MHRIVLPVALLVLAFATSAVADDTLPARARLVLRTHCHRCHGDKGTVEGGVNYLLDRQQLVRRKKIVPGDPAKSRLLQRVTASEMPPEGEKRPSKEEIDILKRWIASGAVDFNPPRARRSWITSTALLETMAADVAKFTERQRRFKRYFTFTHLYNAGVSDDELETYRQALSKLLNSLSWSKFIVAPAPVDTARTIYRIDLRHYKWSSANWALLEKVYPYGVSWGIDADRRLMQATLTAMPHLRGDWFVANAALPPLYHDLLELPTSERALETLLRIDVPFNLRSGQALRAGFNGSGVSRNNRVIERHESLWGVYWKSYDFAGNTGRQNVFTTPDGPGREAHHFQHDGGEILFALPNGLFAYLLVDASGQRIDRGPLDVVSDPRRPDRTVVPGLSCMSCHVRGIIPKEDQIRAHVQKNQRLFPAADVKNILALYTPKDKLLAAMKTDADDFLKAVEKTGCKPGRTEPIVALTQHYEAELDAQQAAAEFLLPASEFGKRLGQSPVAARALASLSATGGTVKRGAFAAAYPSLVLELKLGRPLAASVRVASGRLPSDRPWLDPPSSPVTPPRPRKPRKLGNTVSHFGIINRTHLFRGLTSQHVHAVAAAPRERRFAAETVPGVVTLVNEVGIAPDTHFERHDAAIFAVDISRDGQLLASGSLDQTARLWEAVTGKQLFRLSPHSGPVYAVRFSPDGKSLATGSDRIRLWSVKTGKLIRAFPAEAGSIKALVYDPEGNVLISVGDQVRLWDPTSGKELATLKEHKGIVHAVALSPDGKRLATAGEDRTIVVWDVKEKKPLTRISGHRQTITALLFDSKGELLVSGSGGVRGPNTGETPPTAPGEVKVWNLATGKEIAQFTEHTRGVSGLALSADTRKVLSSGFDQTVRVWYLPVLNPGPFEGHQGPIYSFHRSADGKVLLTGGLDNIGRCWDSDSGKLLQSLTGHTSSIRGMAISGDNKFAWTTGDKTVRQWDLSTGKEVRRWDLPSNGRHLGVSPDGRTIVVGTGTEAKLLDPEKNTSRGLPLKRFRTMTLSPDGKLLAGTVQKDTLVFDVATGKEAARLLDAVGERLVFTPDSKRLAIISGNKVSLFELDGRRVQTFEGHTRKILNIAFNADGSRLLSCSGEIITEPYVVGRTQPRRSTPEDCGYRLWDVATGKQLGVWGGFLGPVGFIAFARDNRHAIIVRPDEFMQRIERRSLQGKGMVDTNP